MSKFESPDFLQLDELFAPEERQLRNRIRAFVDDRFLPVVTKLHRAGTLPLELAPELGGLGAFGPTIQGYGCAGMGNVAAGLIMQELERGDSGLRTFASVQGSLAMMAIHLFGSEDQKNRWLPAMARGEKLGAFALTEPDFGSNPSGMTCRARETADGYVLNGAKKWIGNATVADVIVVWAKTGESDDQAAVRGFLIEKGTAGFNPKLIEGKLSLRVGLTAEICLTDCAIPLDAILPKSRGLRSPLECLNHARFGIAWGAIGAAMACYDEARNYAIDRVQFGKPIASFQLVQAKLVRMLTEISKAQLLALRVAQLKDAGSVKHYHISMAKMNNVAMALDVARTARDILGAEGILDSHACMRHMCNLESVSTYEGTDDIHRLILGQHLTGIPAFGGQ
ncbi:MAG: acyl-CoA dehydrogenase family protein [Chthoniobacterales bacterium]